MLIQLYSETGDGQVQMVVLNTDHFLYARETSKGTVVTLTGNDYREGEPKARTLWVKESVEQVYQKIEGKPLEGTVVENSGPREHRSSVVHRGHSNQRYQRKGKRKRS